MLLRIIGYWAPYPRAGQACPGYLVSSGDSHLLLDCGHGVCSQLARWLPAEKLGAVVITHFHPDHYIDLFAIRHIIRAAMFTGTRQKPLPVYMPTEPDYHYQSFAAMEKELQVLPLHDNSNFTVGPMQVKAFPVDHPIPAWGVKVGCQNRSLVYTSDTSYHQQLVEQIQGTDLLLCEASLRLADGAVAAQLGHMTTADAGRLAREGGAKTLLATHFWPEYELEVLQEEIEQEYNGKIIMADQDLTVPI